MGCSIKKKKKQKSIENNKKNEENNSILISVNLKYLLNNLIMKNLK